MLSSPVVVGPVSPCSDAVRVQGQMPGSQIDVYAVTQAPPQFVSRHVGSAVAASSNELVPLSPGERLLPGEHVTADQRTATDFGPALPAEQAVEVLADPRVADLGGLFCGQTLIECATCLWVDGVIPGATVSLALNNDPPLIVDAQEPRAKFFLSGRLATGDALTATQTACGRVGPPVSLAGVVAQPRSDALPSAPGVDEPLVRCQRAIRLTGVVPGATVVVEHPAGEGRACFGYPTGWFWLAHPLQPGDVVTVRQEFTLCELRSPSGTHTAIDANPSPPWIARPVCEGDRLVRVVGLLAGALVEFEADGQRLCTACAPDDDALFGLPSLLGTEVLTVRQSMCDGADGTWSDWSDPCPVRALGPQSQPRIEEPLIEGGVVVGVNGLQRGSRVQVISPLGVIGEADGTGDVRVDVPLWDPLVFGDAISLRTFRCGKVVSWPGAARVLQRGDLPPPAVADPACDCGGSVLVRGVTHGSIVELYRPAAGGGQTLVGSSPAGATDVSVDVLPLKPGEQLSAAQRIASQRSALGPAATTANPPHWHYEPAHAGDPELARLGAFRLCQLVGDSDPGGRPHGDPTTGMGIHGTDLGVPVDHGGVLHLFFGDEATNNLDPIAMITTTDPEDLETAPPELTWVRNTDGSFHPLTLDGYGLDNFEVPTGGFSYDGKLYLFIGKDKFENPSRMTTSFLAVRDDPHWNFRGQRAISSTTGSQIIVLDPGGGRHPEPYPARRWLLNISPTVVRNADWPGLPSTTGDGLLMFGSSGYRGDGDTTPAENQLGNVYLAWAPLTPGATLTKPPVPTADQWRFYRGMAGDAPIFDTLAAGDPAPLLPVDGPGRPRKLGEISCVWYPSLRRWILTGSVQAPTNVARQPWGPWTASEAVCDAGVPDRDAQDGAVSWTDAHVTYAPYLIGRWHRWDRSLRTATLYFTLSGWDDRPGKAKYKPQLVRSTIKCWP